MPVSPVLATYLTVSRFLVRFADRTLKRRLQAGKEDPDRINERRGIAERARPDGQLLWFHAASVGESLSVLDLIEMILDDRPDLNVLITTGTRTSAELLEKRITDQTIHQFVPLDARAFVVRFLDHWKPDIAVFTESELWPTLICQTHKRRIPMVLLNARMSSKSFKRWRWFRGAARGVLGCFSYILAQDKVTKSHLVSLGIKSGAVEVTGSLKESGGALPHDERERADIAESLKTRPVWLAASTHEGEESAAADAHRIARRRSPRLLLIIAPRHPDRGPEIAAALRADGWSVGLRSAGESPDENIDIYVADTLGEMGLWYRIAPVSFVGGSLAEIGGHNPFEPAALGSAIVHGPHISSAAEAYERLSDAGAARQAANARELGDIIVELQEPHETAAMAHAAWEATTSGAEAIERARALLLDLLTRTESK
ncbi:3-deoxy-D-manno-octulosonic acid transferase [Litoreibacter roseus]|uniref:3-deoxy-D-manno-octulosonic acid transferase n=1 Tax=Litoreibacter roseus TaxID=2601869 RepID=A0A6N6JLF4_9RHOB|nr:3-deoxy-D-manno-octulosonic acid transferase [Litoreibacter roseus]GFE66249.1 3-deoxy-D-manno-octulosonic acid transferase [Litoreibacter roseus]